MAEVLAVGISHYPPLTGSDDRMSYILKRMLQNPRLPEKYRHPEGWPAPMRDEWGTDEGTASAVVHRQRLVGELRKVRAALDAFRPDFVVIWGDDQLIEIAGRVEGHEPDQCARLLGDHDRRVRHQLAAPALAPP